MIRLAPSPTSWPDGAAGTAPCQDARQGPRLLLVLDNFEQVQDAAPFVADLLAAAPETSVLVTSRSPLHLAAEHEYPVPPLPLPDPAGPHELAALDRSGAVRLFVQRAQAARPDFHLTAENAPAVAEICRLLDGLPLAIELAAARIKLLPPQALLDRLRPARPPRPRSRSPARPGRLGLLTGGARDLPERQQTLRRDPRLEPRPAGPARAAPLRPPGRLRRGLHPGGRHRRLRRPEALPAEPLDLLASLVDKSLLRQEEPAPGAVPLPDAGDGAGVRRRAPGAERRGARRAPGPRRPLPGPGRASRAGAARPAARRSGSSASASRTRTSAPPSAPPSPSETPPPPSASVAPCGGTGTCGACSGRAGAGSGPPSTSGAEALTPDLRPRPPRPPPA